MSDQTNTSATPETPAEMEGMTWDDLTPEEQTLLTALRQKNYRKAANLIERKFAHPDWTYEHRLALACIARLALEGVLSDDLLDSPSANYIERIIDRLAETISDSLHALGGYTDLQKLFDDASCAPNGGGAS